MELKKVGDEVTFNHQGEMFTRRLVGVDSRLGVYAPYEVSINGMYIWLCEDELIEKPETQLDHIEAMLQELLDRKHVINITCPNPSSSFLR